MIRIFAALCTVLSILCSCNGSSGRKNKDNGLQFSVDTAQLKRSDSMAVEQRRSDLNLLKRAGSTPGINAGMDKFEVRTPAGWRRIDTLIGNIRVLMLDTASVISGFRTNISIVGDSLRGLSVDDYLKGTINSLLQYVPRFSFIGKGDRSIGGRSARWIHYSQNRGGTGLENICYIVPDDNVVYVVTCSALKGRLVQNYPAFEGAIRSFSSH